MPSKQSKPLRDRIAQAISGDDSGPSIDADAVRELAALLDEISIWPTDETSAEPDIEVINAIKPGMATTALVKSTNVLIQS